MSASAHSGYVGGSFGKKTGVFDCSGGGKAANAYAQAQDVVSGRWSPRLPVYASAAPSCDGGRRDGDPEDRPGRAGPPACPGEPSPWSRDLLIGLAFQAS
ncbi:hypothetical protein [Microbispora bryophytorum]|uniref:hypothetical protein n=1 Tax=Microbispora bryophytorum TaxID=1460882 RepID=UPI0033DFCA05